MYGNNKSEISGTKWDEEFELTDRSYSASEMQGYVEYTIKKHKIVTDKSPVQIYVYKIQNRITFKIKTGYLNILNIWHPILWNYLEALKDK